MYIYTITNIKNGKIYVGTSIGRPEAQLDKFYSAAVNQNKNGEMYADMRKYGADNFVVEVIRSDVSSETEALKLQRFYIDHYNTMIKGYNESYGNPARQKDSIDLEKLHNQLDELKEKIDKRKPKKRILGADGKWKEV